MNKIKRFEVRLSEEERKILEQIKTHKNVFIKDELHLSVSMRSFRAEHVSLLIKQILDMDVKEAQKTLMQVKSKYPIVITRDISKAKELALYVVISCHTFEDIEKAINNKADVITYSPIFETPNKGIPKGIKALKEVVDKYPNINIIALGGIINDEQIEQISKTKAYGIASIRVFALSICCFIVYLLVKNQVL